MLDEGKLTDSQGRSVDFRNTLTLLTSNLGAEYLLKLKESEPVEKVKEQVMTEVRSAFRPEFLNDWKQFCYFRSHQSKV